MISKAVVTEDNRQYFYIVNPVEIPNALRTAVTILQEYSITNMFGENYKLYKTKEGLQEYWIQWQHSDWD